MPRGGWLESGVCREISSKPMISMDPGVPHEVNAEIASWGRVVAHFPARMQPKQCYDSLTLNHAALRLGEGKIC